MNNIGYRTLNDATNKCSASVLSLVALHRFPYSLMYVGEHVRVYHKLSTFFSELKKKKMNDTQKNTW